MATSSPTDLHDDAELLRRVADGDALAFESLYDRYRARAFGLAMRLTGHPGTAEEVTQDVFLKLWHSAGNYDPARGSLGSWLLTFVRHRAIDMLRSGARHERNVELDGALQLPALERTEEQVEGREESRNARRMVEALPSEQRQVIELAYFRGMTQGEIAAAVGIPLGTVKGRSRLALEKLRRRVEAQRAMIAA
jgi:RNA polymerase sigma-70 factor (ECF subfamily)